MDRVLGNVAHLCCWILLVSAVVGCGGGSSSTSSNSSSGSGVHPAPCSPKSMSGGPYCLTFIGTQFDVHIGQQFKVAIVASDGTTFKFGHTIAALPSAGFYVNFPQALQAGVQYYVDYYADENGNGQCDPPPIDHVWRSHIYIDFYNGTITKLPPATGDMTWAVVHDDPWVNNPVGNDTCPQLNQF